MKKTILSLAFAALGLSTASIAAQVQAGATFSGDGMRSFYFAVGNYYQVPEPEVAVVRGYSLPPEEVPVAFYIAQCARVSPTVVIDLLRRGATWAGIATHFQFTPDIYYFRDGPPYGKAYGYWKKHPPQDFEVIDAVNIHFLSEYHHVTPDVVRTERSRRGNYMLVSNDFAAKSHKGGDGGKHEGQDKGRGHGKGHDR